MKDHVIAQVVNALRDAAVTHHASGQLRERLRGCIEPLLLAIAPPVAAGSVDTVEFNDSLADYVTSRVLHKPYTMERRDRLIDRINAWGAQQREAGRKDEAARILHLTYERDFARKAARIAEGLAVDIGQRAEKAEADLKARDFFVDVLNCQVKKAQGEADVLFHRLNAANGHLAMARERIEELETEIKVLHQG